MLGRLDLPDDAFQPWSPNDQAKARVLLESAFCATHALWREEIHAMVRKWRTWCHCVHRSLTLAFQTHATRSASYLMETANSLQTQAREFCKCELEALNLIPTSTGRRDALVQFVQRALLQGDFV